MTETTENNPECVVSSQLRAPEIGHSFLGNRHSRRFPWRSSSLRSLWFIFLRAELRSPARHDRPPERLDRLRPFKSVCCPYRTVRLVHGLMMPAWSRSPPNRQRTMTTASQKSRQFFCELRSIATTVAPPARKVSTSACFGSASRAIAATSDGVDDHSIRRPVKSTFVGIQNNADLPAATVSAGAGARSDGGFGHGTLIPSDPHAATSEQMNNDNAGRCVTREAGAALPAPGRAERSLAIIFGPAGR